MVLHTKLLRGYNDSWFLESSFREGDFFQFPNHADYKYAKFEDRLHLEHAKAYVTTSVKGVFKDYKNQYDYIAETKNL